MDKEEERSILSKRLKRYRRRSYAELQELLNSQETFEIPGASGTVYQVEVSALWDDKKNGHLRVYGSVDDGGLRAFFPLTDDFIIAPDGSFVAEKTGA